MSKAKPRDFEGDVELSKPKAPVATGRRAFSKDANDENAPADASTLPPHPGGLRGKLSNLYSGMFHDGLVRFLICITKMNWASFLSCLRVLFFRAMRIDGGAMSDERCSSVSFF